MASAEPAHAAFDDLTARARIREAALAQFAEHGFDRATIRGIAAAAGVSPGLVRHHFGSKQELRDTVDEHVFREIQRVSDEVMADGRRGDLGPAVATRQALRPFQRYILRALTEGSPIAAALFDRLAGPTEQWIALADEHRTDPPFADRRTRAATYTAMVLGVLLLHEQLSQVFGADIFSPEGERLLGAALLDIYSHALISPQLAATARDELARRHSRR